MHKELVAYVECAHGNGLSAVTNATRKNTKIMTERIGRSVHKKVMPLADQSRKSKEEEDFFGRDFKNLLILTRNHVDVIATQKNKLADLSQNIRRRCHAGMTDDSI